MYSEEEVNALIEPYKKQIELLNAKLAFYEAQIRSLQSQLRRKGIE